MWVGVKVTLKLNSPTVHPCGVVYLMENLDRDFIELAKRPQLTLIFFFFINGGAGMNMISPPYWLIFDTCYFELKKFLFLLMFSFYFHFTLQTCSSKCSEMTCDYFWPPALSSPHISHIFYRVCVQNNWSTDIIASQKEHLESKYSSSYMQRRMLLLD